MILGVRSLESIQNFQSSVLSNIFGYHFKHPSSREAICHWAADNSEELLKFVHPDYIHVCLKSANSFACYHDGRWSDRNCTCQTKSFIFVPCGISDLYIVGYSFKVRRRGL
jgi:serine protease inhibitor